MSNELTVKDNDYNKTNNQDRSTSVVDIKCSKLSERIISDIERIIYRRAQSENQIKSDVNYDDLCGAWIYPENPIYSRYVKRSDPSLCVWKYFTEEDLVYLKQHQQNKDVICSFFENKFLNKNIEKSKSVLTKILWEFFRFARYHSLSL
ncbi:uncharacterized protein LOC117608285 [Osmia lignaria lignaria]|uniref:uncharacterized protein LOC117608285 n=1 Tax=Osmia lignaria lignaria TaxID=1437193 RepID=UPI001478EC90|nr:uncharacterized protein LOC117608285 [Osmia lignaria]